MFYNSLNIDKKKRRLNKILIFVLLALSLVYISKKIYRYWSNNASRYDLIIFNVAKKYSLDPKLIKALIWKESGFRPYALGKKGEIGLMQIMHNSAVKDWEKYNKRNILSKGALYDPVLNIEIGSWYLAKCKQHWLVYNESDMLALAEYNAGFSNVKRWLSQNGDSGDVTLDSIGFAYTKGYVGAILNQYDKYKVGDSLDKVNKKSYRLK